MTLKNINSATLIMDLNGDFCMAYKIFFAQTAGLKCSQMKTNVWNDRIINLKYQSITVLPLTVVYEHHIFNLLYILTDFC